MTVTTYAFTAANGTAIPGGLTGYMPGGGAQNIQSNKLRSVPSAVSTLPPVAGFQTSVAVLNPVVSITVTMPATLDSRVFRLFGRASADWNDYDNSDTGYALSLSADANTNNCTLRTVTPTSRPVIATSSFVCVASHDVTIELTLLTGGGIQGRIWDVTAGGTRPSTPNLSATDTTNTVAGISKFRTTGPVINASITQDVDNFIIDDQLSGTTGVATSATITTGVDIGVTMFVSGIGGTTPSVPVSSLGDCIIGVRKMHLAVISIQGA